MIRRIANEMEREHGKPNSGRELHYGIMEADVIRLGFWEDIMRKIYTDSYNKGMILAIFLLQGYHDSISNCLKGLTPEKPAEMFNARGGETQRHVKSMKGLGDSQSGAPSKQLWT